MDAAPMPMTSQAQLRAAVPGRAAYAPDDAALVEALRPLVAARFGPGTEVTRLDRQPVINAVEQIQVHLGGTCGGRTWQLVAKFGNRLNTEKELLLYRHVLTPEVTGAPELYGSIYNAAAHHYWLFLEPLRGDYWQVDDPAQIALALAHLARLHTQLEVPAARALAGEPAALLRLPAPPETADRVLACLSSGLGQAAFPANRQRVLKSLRLQTVAAAAEPTCVEIAAPQARFVERLAVRFERVLAALDLLPPTLLHHDFHRWNVRLEPPMNADERGCGTPAIGVDLRSSAVSSSLVLASGSAVAGAARVRLHDWEAASLGCRQFDLYYVPNPFLPWEQGQWDGAVPPELAEFALRCYWQAHNESARARLTWDEFRDVQCFVSLYRTLANAQLQLQGGPTGVGLPDPTRLNTLHPRHRGAARSALDEAARISRFLGL
jgi:hypothetical protein